MLRLYSQFGLVIAPARYFLGSASRPAASLLNFLSTGESDLYMAQAADGTGRSHWHAGYPISKAASSKPTIRSCIILTSELHISDRQLADGIYELLQTRALIFIRPRLSYYLNTNGQNTNDHNPN